MPYIKPGRRGAFDHFIDQLDGALWTAGDIGGDLNYVVTRLLVKKLKRQGVSYENVSTTLADVTECIQETRRRILAPYENVKIEENGDVFTEILPAGLPGE